MLTGSSAYVPQVDALFDNFNCSRGLYFDMGSNRGVQVRKLYEPEEYLRATDDSIPVRMHSGFRQLMGRVSQHMRQVFGPSPRCGVCSIGMEPNPVHQERLLKISEAYGKQGYGVKFLQVAASTEDGQATLADADAYLFPGGLPSKYLGVAANILSHDQPSRKRGGSGRWWWWRRRSRRPGGRRCAYDELRLQAPQRAASRRVGAGGDQDGH